ncbi:HPr family phosphocarrier protein [Sporolactobacillus sp. STCC-11]|uniref:HPr family phosphocarrier protein n=1 Tax=Sporolactobacillus caesalpiniae TaxID=3230362 RepID=UPI003391C4BA
MLTKEVTIGLEKGLQARSAALFVQNANEFRSNLTLVKDGHVASMKSVMGVMCSALACGDQILLTAEGEDERAALETLTDFIEQKHCELK